MQRFVGALMVLCSLVVFTRRASACGSDYCDWSGLYNTGGYGLYNFGIDFYNAIDYSSDQDYWGGSCGSFSSGCSSAYDVSSYQFIIDTYSAFSGMCGGYCSGSYSGYEPGYSQGGVLSWSGLQGPGNPLLNSPALASPFLPLPPQSSYWTPPSTIPMNPGGVFPVTTNPYAPTNPFIPAPPTTTLPWGGCNNVIVMCPTIPLPGGFVGTPPGGGFVGTPPGGGFVGTPPGGGFVWPPTGGSSGGVFSPQTNTIPVSPIRYKIPRGAHGR